ncbi:MULTISPECIES: PilZ domain-containing protein [Sphingomonas]|uniref:PilZ domain-containing protein n=1 Tax=Sphingomonas TaxID=13687 RepID=UPI000DEEB631|nr:MULTISPECIES: PilZ domain-containing protein [Sphingomonas]
MTHAFRHDPFLEEHLSLPDDPRHLPRAERRTVELKGYLVRENCQIVDVTMVDLSYDGCAVRTLVPLTVGERVKVSALGRGSTNATVRWYRDRTAGLLFETARKKTIWPRKAERVAVFGEASLRRAGRLTYRVKSFDVTRFGCRCEFVERPSIRESVWIKFDGLQSLESTVCWVENVELGLHFRNEMHPAVFDLLVAQLSQPPSP